MNSVLIIGGGASGAAAAITLARLQSDLSITILEKNERILKKLLTTGNGKCNITNTAVSPAVYESAFAQSVAARFDFESVQAFLTSLSLPIKADPQGRCYPLSESAANAVNAFLNALESYSVTVKTGQEVRAIKKEGKRFVVTAAEVFEADAVIFAIGSAAAVKGYNGLDLMHNLGWHIERPRPALCPIPSDEAFLKELQGVRVKAALTLGEHRESGEVQLNADNISGICAFNLAKYVKSGDTLLLNFLPAQWSEAELLHYLKASAATAPENAALLNFLLPRKLALVVLKRAGLKPSASPATLSDDDFTVLAKLLGAFPVRVEAPTDYRRAQTVCGGLDARFVAPDTLAAKAYPGLFVCGEVLDADAPCGGFNLHWAWASGMCAARAANAYLTGETL